MPVSYCFGASVLHTHLWQGGGVVFDSRFMFPDKVLAPINIYGCTTFAGVPAVYNILLRRSNSDPFRFPAFGAFFRLAVRWPPKMSGTYGTSCPTQSFL